MKFIYVLIRHLPHCRPVAHSIHVFDHQPTDAEIHELADKQRTKLEVDLPEFAKANWYLDFVEGEW